LRFRIFGEEPPALSAFGEAGGTRLGLRGGVDNFLGRVGGGSENVSENGGALGGALDIGDAGGESNDVTLRLSFVQLFRNGLGGVEETGRALGSAVCHRLNTFDSFLGGRGSALLRESLVAFSTIAELTFCTNPRPCSRVRLGVSSFAGACVRRKAGETVEDGTNEGGVEGAGCIGLAKPGADIPMEEDVGVADCGEIGEDMVRERTGVEGGGAIMVTCGGVDNDGSAAGVT
jgi:hypothetical protein